MTFFFLITHKSVISNKHNANGGQCQEFMTHKRLAILPKTNKRQTVPLSN